MGNEQSIANNNKAEPSRRRPGDGLSDINTSQTTLKSQPLNVDSIWYDHPDTPTSESNSDVEDLRDGLSIRSHVPQTLVDESEEFVISDVVQQLTEVFVKGPASSQLLVGFMDLSAMEKITDLAKLVGFEGCTFNLPYIRLQNPMHPDEADIRLEYARRSLDDHERQLDEMGLNELDTLVERYLSSQLLELAKSRTGADWKGEDFDIEGFILPADNVFRIFHSVGKQCHLEVDYRDKRIALIEGEAEGKSERVIQKGELVWRRLQHWSTNVRKEKKFNIWAKGLPDDVKQRILEIAIEIGFETASIQPNGNIHLEIKPPEGQHRRKLKHATDELRMELEPIDDAVCQNVEQHLEDWLSDFHKNKKQKDVLNCRFVLPAEWLRQTAGRLAAQYGLLVSMETGIDLLFYRPDVDPKAQETPKEPLKKTKSKNRSKKKHPDPPHADPSSNGHHPVDQDRLHLFDSHLGDPTLLRQVSNPRRPAGRSKYDYGWDPSWPMAHPDNATSHTH